MTRPTPARRRTARTVRGTGSAVRTTAPLGPIAIVLLNLEPGSLRLDMPGWHLVVVLLAGLGVDRLGMLLHDAGDHIERHRPAAS
ncbi:hypothetical protein AB0420_02305 [Streptomyces caelestis]|uniref:hypothetical protein n=1 Tax=Streptomyces caelestis TaxID=36816 RepID=UPI00344D3924